MTLANDSHSQLEIARAVGDIFLYLVNSQTHEKEVDMSAKVEISRTDRTAGDLKAMAKKSKCKDHRRRLRAIARVLAGEESRGEVAKRAGVDVQTLRDWVRRYNEEGADGLKNRPRSGRRARLDADQAEAVREWLEAGPDPGAGEPARRAVADIRRRIENLFEIKYSVEGVRLPVRRLGFRNVSPRPIHPKADPRAQERIPQQFQGVGEESPARRRVSRKRGRLVPGRGADRPEGHAVAGLGAQGDATAHPSRPQVRILLSVLRRLPLDRPGRRPCLRAGQYRRNEPASRGCRRSRPRGRARNNRTRRRGPAPLQGSGGSRQRFPASAAALQSGTRSHGNGFLAAQAQAFREPRVPDRRACPRCRRGGMEQLRGASERSQKNHRSGLGRAMKNRAIFISESFLVLVLDGGFDARVDSINQIVWWFEDNWKMPFIKNESLPHGNHWPNMLRAASFVLLDWQFWNEGAETQKQVVIENIKEFLSSASENLVPVFILANGNPDDFKAELNSSIGKSDSQQPRDASLLAIERNSSFWDGETCGHRKASELGLWQCVNLYAEGMGSLIRRCKKRTILDHARPKRRLAARILEELSRRRC